MKSTKMKKKTKISAEVVEIVTQRAQGYCETCGGNAEDSMALHHRKLRSRGGEHSVANLIWVHHGCHNLDTNSIHSNPSHAQDKGWMVGSWQIPEEAPFCRPDGSIVLLQSDGSVTVLTEG
jgi:hypothetical protein